MERRDESWKHLEIETSVGLFCNDPREKWERPDQDCVVRMESQNGVGEVSGEKLYDLVTRCPGPRDPKYLHYVSQRFLQRRA